MIPLIIAITGISQGESGKQLICFFRPRCKEILDARDSEDHFKTNQQNKREKKTNNKVIKK